MVNDKVTKPPLCKTNKQVKYILGKVKPHRTRGDKMGARCFHQQFCLHTVIKIDCLATFLATSCAPLSRPPPEGSGALLSMTVLLCRSLPAFVGFCRALSEAAECCRERCRIQPRPAQRVVASRVLITGASSGQTTDSMRPATGVRLIGSCVQFTL